MKLYSARGCKFLLVERRRVRLLFLHDSLKECLLVCIGRLRNIKFRFIMQEIVTSNPASALTSWRLQSLQRPLWRYAPLRISAICRCNALGSDPGHPIGTHSGSAIPGGVATKAGRGRCTVAWTAEKAGGSGSQNGSGGHSGGAGEVERGPVSD